MDGFIPPNLGIIGDIVRNEKLSVVCHETSIGPLEFVGSVLPLVSN